MASKRVDDVAAERPSDLPPASLSRLPVWAADPALVVFDDRFFLYPTTDGIEEWEATAFRAYSSIDLETWTDHGEVFRLGQDVAWSHDRAWAPAAIRDADRYVLYFTAGSEMIGAAVAASPVGPFVDIGKPLVRPGQWAGVAIDPSVFRDRDGRVYLSWGNSTMHTVLLAPDLVSFDPADVVSHQPPEFCEAAFIHRRGDVYYLTWSQNDTRSPDYSVRYATGPGPLGPWTDRGFLVRKSEALGVVGTGHHSIVHVEATDTWVIAYHAFTPGSDGYHRAIRFDFLHHRDDGLLDEVLPVDGARIDLTSPRLAPRPFQPDKKVGKRQ